MSGHNFLSTLQCASYSSVWCLVRVCGWRCDPLSLEPTFPRGIFPAASRVAWSIEWCSVLCAADLAYLQAVSPSVGHGPARLAQPLQLEREFLLHSILNSLASGDRGARTSAVHTAANMPILRAPRPDLNIYLSSLTVLSDETCTGWVSRVSVSQDTITWDTCAGVQDSQTQTADTGFLHRDRCLSSTLVL